VSVDYVEPLPVEPQRGKKKKKKKGEGEKKRGALPVRPCLDLVTLRILVEKEKGGEKGKREKRIPTADQPECRRWPTSRGKRGKGKKGEKEGGKVANDGHNRAGVSPPSRPGKGGGKKKKKKKKKRKKEKKRKKKKGRRRK